MCQTEAGSALVVRAGAGLVYVNAERVARRVLAAARCGPRAVLLDCAALALLDHAAMQALERLAAALAAAGHRLLPYNVSADLLHKYEQLAGVERRALRATSAGAALAAAPEPRAAASSEAAALLAQ